MINRDCITLVYHKGWLCLTSRKIFEISKLVRLNSQSRCTEGKDYNRKLS